MKQRLIFRGEAADIIGCTGDTVTNLARRGVLTVIEKTPGGRRKYDPDEVRRVGVEWRAKYGTPEWWKEK